jgi:tetratricopeptide (TPR) repeat protein
VKRAYRAAETHGETWQSLSCLGAVLSIRGDFDEAIRYLRRAEELNPSAIDVKTYLINVYARSDRAAEALPLIELVKRLDPGDFTRQFRDFNFAMTYYALGRLEEAAYYARRSLEGLSRNSSNVRMLLFCLVELGQLDEARELAARMQAGMPDFRISRLESMIPPQPKLLERYKAALRKIGAPE